MRLTVFAMGSRGDVQPMVALARGLQEAGVEVTVGVDAAFEAMVRAQGLVYARVEGDIQQALESESGRQALASGSNPVAMARLVRRNIEPILQQLIEDSIRATDGADALLLGGVAYYPGTILAEARRIPFAQAYLQPMIPTRAFPSPMLPLPFRKDRALYNWASFAIGGQAFWQILRPIVNRVRRREFGLRPWPLYGNFGALLREQVLQVCGYSPHVLPRPADWPEHVKVTGYWFLDEAEWEAPDLLRRYLEAGPPPVCVGFGSMRHFAPAPFTRAIVEALREVGARAIFLEGWGGIDRGEVPSDYLVLREASHEWLYPRCAAILHHGGAGATAAALRAGKPMIPVPFFGDRAFWAWRVEEMGVAPESIARDDLTAPRLARALRRALHDPRFARNAMEVGALVRAEDGVGDAVTHLLRFFGSCGVG